MRISASRAFSRLRAASTTSAPRRANSRAVCQPMPLLEPVTMTRRPSCDGIFEMVQGTVFIGKPIYAHPYLLAIRHLFCLYLPLGYCETTPTTRTRSTERG